MQPQNKSESSATTPRRRPSDDKILQIAEDKDDDARSESIASLSQHGVSLDTIQRIEKKNKLEEQARSRNQHMLDKQEYLREIEQHNRLAEGIRTLFISNMNKPILANTVV